MPWKKAAIFSQRVSGWSGTVSGRIKLPLASIVVPAGVGVVGLTAGLLEVVGLAFFLVVCVPLDPPLPEEPELEPEEPLVALALI